MTEPSPIRDNGPFQNVVQALQQFNAQTHGMPFDNNVLTFQVVQEALLLTGVQPSQFEIEYFRESNKLRYDPVLSQILAAWIIRAHIAANQETPR